jgi:hypothetical protein
MNIQILGTLGTPALAHALALSWVLYMCTKQTPQCEMQRVDMGEVSQEGSISVVKPVCMECRQHLTFATYL